MAPGNPDLQNIIAQAQQCLGQGRANDCEALCQQALIRAPGHPVALQLLALAARAQGRLEAAADYLHQALASAPDDPRLTNSLGVIVMEQSHPEDAAALFRQAIAQDPAYAKAYGNLGTALLQTGQTAEALTALQQAVTLAPDDLELLFNLANAQRLAGDGAGARETYQACLTRNGSFAPALANLAALALESGDLAEAEPLFRRALAVDDSQAETWVNLAKVLEARDRKTEAETALAEARRRDPGHLGALLLDAQNRREAGDWQGALDTWRQVEQRAPNDLRALTGLAGLLQQACLWSELVDVAARLDGLGDQASGADLPAEPPLLYLAHNDDPRANLAVQQAWSQDIARRMASTKNALAFRYDAAPRQRLTLGYLSQDYRDHPVGHLVRGLFAAHDRERVAVHGYSYGPDDGSRWRREIERDCDRFVELRGESFAAAARQIHQDGVDILIDLTGHTKNNRLEICALGPAPIVMSWLGFPGGTGADFIDYLIVDPVVAPAADKDAFAEALIALPQAYQVNDDRQPIPDEPQSRADHGLDPDGFVFVCFNQTAKIEPVMFDAWMRILQAVPQSQLWLLEKTDGLAAQSLRQQAAACGVVPERLVFAGRLPKAQHLARLQLADLMLDTRLYNGHTTASDALWAGVPLVALEGRHFASRVSTSLLRAVDLPELSVSSLADYEALAIALARDRVRLTALKTRLWENRSTLPLFDTARFARGLEAAYEQAWQIYERGEKPESFSVADQPA